MDQHEAYLKRRAARAEARRRERASRTPPSVEPDKASDAPASEPNAALSDGHARAIEQIQADQLRAREVARMKSKALKKRAEAAALASERAAEQMRRVEEVPENFAQAKALPGQDDAQGSQVHARREADAEEAERRAEVEDARRQADDDARDPVSPETPDADAPTADNPEQAAAPAPDIVQEPSSENSPAVAETGVDATPGETAPEPLVLTPEHQASDPSGAEDALAAPPVVAPAATPRTPPQAAPEVAAPAEHGWDTLPHVSLDSAHLDRHRLISAARKDPAHVAFDVLRTRLLAALQENGWNRVAITSATKNCGKSFVAANLAISLSRQTNCYTILSDLDLRRPSLASIFGVPNAGKIGQFLNGDADISSVYRRVAKNPMHIGDNLALGLNRRPESYAAELLQGPETGPALARLHEALRPDVHLFDLPPALYHDDVLAFRPHFDGVLLVVGGGITKPNEIREVKRRLGEDTPLLGVIMNQAEGLSIADYNY